MDFEDVAASHRTDLERLASRLLAGHSTPTTRDDLVQAGLVGLWQASSRYDSSCGPSLWNYAKERVRGAMVDELRVQSSRSRLAQEAMRQDTWHLKTPWANVFSVPMTAAAHLSSGETGHDVLEASERAALVRAALRRLPAKTAEVVRRVYLEGERVTDVAVSVGVTPSRGCQVLGEGLRLLRRSLTPAEVAGLADAPAAVAPTMRGRGVGRMRTLAYGCLDLPLSAWAEKTGIPRGTLLSRLRRGWSVRKALETPVGPAARGPHSHNHREKRGVRE